MLPVSSRTNPFDARTYFPRDAIFFFRQSFVPLSSRILNWVSPPCVEYRVRVPATCRNHCIWSISPAKYAVRNKWTWHFWAWKLRFTGLISTLQMGSRFADIADPVSPISALNSCFSGRSCWYNLYRTVDCRQKPNLSLRKHLNGIQQLKWLLNDRDLLLRLSVNLLLYSVSRFRYVSVIFLSRKFVADTLKICSRGWDNNLQYLFRRVAISDGQETSTARKKSKAKKQVQSHKKAHKIFQRHCSIVVTF